MGRGAHKIALVTHTSSSSPPYSTFTLASMEDCDLADEATDSDPSETLCCKFHTQIDSSPLGSLETEQSLLHLDLPQPQASRILVWARARANGDGKKEKEKKLKLENRRVELTTMEVRLVMGCINNRIGGQ
nr:hypothetical protein CFP56_49470 [Quercus suber]